MKKTIAGLLLCMLFGMETKMNAQSIAFQRVDSIPVVVNSITLNNAWAGGINFPLFSEIDLNGDGIHDLFLYDRTNNRISTFINDGTPGVTAWQYTPQYISRFPPVIGWARLYDYNCDGKMDLFTLSNCNCGVAVWRNDYNTTTGLQFTLVTQLLMEEFDSTSTTQVYATAFSLPAFGDVDNDGDMDIIGYNVVPDGRVMYHRNFSMEQYGICDSLIFQLTTPNTHWGSFQLLIGGTNSVYCFSCRHTLPALTDSSLTHYDQSQAAARDDTISGVFMIDIDGDHDKDLLFGDSGSPSTNTLLVVNGGTPDSAAMVSQDVTFPSNNVPVNINSFPVHSYIDLDNDSIKDLIAAPTEFENLKGMWLYKNTGSDSAPDLHWQTNAFLVDQMIDVGEGACPVLFDADGDGLSDMIIGNYGIAQFGGSYKNGLQYFRNTGTATSPAFEFVSNNYATISALALTGPIYPAFGDLDGDGDQDMIIGSDDGKLVFYNNTAGPGNPALFGSPVGNYMGIDVGSTSTPQLIDLNRDSLTDLVIGNKTGLIKFFQNTGTTASPSFANTPTKDTLGGINVQITATPDGYAVPFFFSENSVFKLLVSCSKGDVYLYDNIDGNLSGNFNLVETMISATQGTRLKFNLAVSGGDLNNDGLTDMLLGIYGGGVNIYMQHLTTAIVELPSIVNPSFVIAPNPASDACSIIFFNLPPGAKNRLRMMNYLGQEVFSKSLNTDRIKIDTREFSTGVYLLQLLTGANSVTQKLVVRH